MPELIRVRYDVGGTTQNDLITGTVMRETRRRDQWTPRTLGDVMRTRRMRVYMAKWPRIGPRPFLRHGEPGGLEVTGEH